MPDANYVWSEGLDYGEFAGVKADRYQKDLPVGKALFPEVLLAYEMNGEPLSRNRGGPVRLIVPGWFGTNMTKWLCKLSLHSHRAQGPFTTTFYNEIDPTDPNGGMRPVWTVEPNSMIVNPAQLAKLQSPEIEIRGWAWSYDGINAVEVSLDGGHIWTTADVEQRVDFSWQLFTVKIPLQPGYYTAIARAISSSGAQQPMSGRRNHVHFVQFEVLG